MEVRRERKGNFVNLNRVHNAYYAVNNHSTPSHGPSPLETIKKRSLAAVVGAPT